MFRNMVAIPFLCAILFGCIGPPVGSLVISIPDALAQSPDPAGTIGLTAFFSYLYGYIPAFCTGLLAGLILPRVRPSIFIALCGLLGFVLAFGFAATWRLGNPFAYIPFWNIIIRMALPGLLGGSICGLLTSVCFGATRKPRAQGNLPN